MCRERTHLAQCCDRLRSSNVLFVTVPELAVHAIAPALDRAVCGERKDVVWPGIDGLHLDTHETWHRRRNGLHDAFATAKKYAGKHTTAADDVLKSEWLRS